MTETLKSFNAGLAFLLELAALTAFGYWGFYGGKSVAARWLLGIGLPVLTALLWAMFLAPRASRGVNATSGNILSLIVFGLAAAALYYTGHPVLAITFAAIAIVNRVLIGIWKQW